MENPQDFMQNNEQIEESALQVVQSKNADEISIEKQEEKTDDKGKNVLFKVFDMLEMFCWAFFIIFAIFTVLFRTCRVDGASMNNTLSDNELLLVSSIYTPKQGDIVVFQICERGDTEDKMLVKRVIATEGQTVKINFNTKDVFVDGVLYDDSEFAYYNPAYSTLTASYDYNADTKIFETTVPEGKIFVLGDNRNISKDSRSNDVGFVDANRVIGKVFFRFSPITFY